MSAPEPDKADNGLSLLPNDRWFKDSPDCGDPDCICSRCGKVIEEEEAPVIRVFDSDRNRERRYHAACLGLEFADKEPWEEA